MGIRFDVVYTTKELSRVLATHAKTANEIVRRALLYIARTKDAHLSYSHAKMIAFKLPHTRKEPTDVKIIIKRQNTILTTALHRKTVQHVKTTINTTDLQCTLPD
jgi:hypothetical protein